MKKGWKVALGIVAALMVLLFAGGIVATKLVFEIRFDGHINTYNTWSLYPFDGLRADEVWLIEAKDADSLKQLEALAQSRLERKGEESITYSPEQYEVVQKAEVITAGNYLVVIVSPDVQDLLAVVNEAIN